MSRGRKHQTKSKQNASNSSKSALESIDHLRANIKKVNVEKVAGVDTFKRNMVVSVMVITILSISMGVVIISLPTIDNLYETSIISVDEDGSLSNLIFKDLNGNDFDLITYRGSHIFIDVMGTTCQPCLVQVEILQEFTLLYPHVKIVSISTDSIAMLTTFQTSHSCSWKLLHDGYGISSSLNIAYIPTMIHISPDFQESHRNVGVTDIETLSSWVT